MWEYLIALEGLQKVFLACAVLGGGVFLLRATMMLLGADHGLDAAGGHGDLHVDSQDSDVSFHWLTIQGITAFLLMFGAVGFCLERTSGLTWLASLAGALAAGIFALWFTAKLFGALAKLKSSGTLEMDSAIGQEGSVYLTIKAGSTGKVEVAVQERLMVLDAVACNKEEEIKTGERVMVVRVLDNSVLMVERASG